MMQFSAAQIAEIINGKVEGDEATTVTSFGKIEEATKGQLSFLANPKYEEFLYKTAASIIIVNASLQLKQPVSNTLIKVEDAYSAFATLLDIYQKYQTQQVEGIEQPLYQHPTAKIGEHVYLGAFSYLGKNVVIGNHSKIFPGVYLGDHVTIGENTVLHAGVKIYHHCHIGSNVMIHAGTVIGSDGFGFAPQLDGTLRKIPQTGNVIIHDDVEIGANCTIDRATIGSTVIHRGAKLDNLLQIAHNVEIGHNTVIAAQTGVSGSTKIGKNVMIGGQTGIAGHIQIADGTKINGKSGVTKTIKKTNTAVTGNPAYDFNASMKSQAALKNLPALEKRVKELENIINNINKKG